MSWLLQARQAQFLQNKVYYYFLCMTKFIIFFVCKWGVGWCFCEMLLYLQIMEAKGATPVGCLTIGKCFRIVGCCWPRSVFRNISKTFDGLLVLMTGQLCMPIENQVCPKGGRNEKRTQLYKESTLLASRSHSSYTLLSRYMLYWATKVFCTICETMYRRNLKTHISKVHPGAEESSSSGQLVALPPPVTCFIALLSHKNHILPHQGRAPQRKVSDQIDLAHSNCEWMYHLSRIH